MMKFFFAPSRLTANFRAAENRSEIGVKKGTRLETRNAFKSQNADVEELSRRLCSLATTTHVQQQLTQFLLTSIIKKIEEGKIQFPSRIPDLLMRNKKAESGSVNAMRHVKGKNAASL